MSFLYSPAFLSFLGLLMADVVAGIGLLGLARSNARLGNWQAAERWYARRLAAPLPATRLLLDGLHGQRPWLQHERLRTLLSFGRFAEAESLCRELADARGTPDWLKVVVAAEAAAQAARAGHLEPALGRLDDLLGTVPVQVGQLRAMVQATRLPVLAGLGRWEEAEAAVAELETVALAAPGEWPVHRFLLLLAKDEERELLRLARPLIEAEDEPSALPEPGASSRVAGSLLAARAAASIGWSELQGRLLGAVAVAGEWSPLTHPVHLALEALSAAAAGEAAEADRLAGEAAAALAAIDHAPGPTADTELLLAEADGRLGRHDAARDRAAAALKQARSPLARLRAARTLGELAEAAGRPDEAVAAYEEALASGVETRATPGLKARIARLQSA